MSITKREFNDELQKEHDANMLYLQQSELPKWLWDLYPKYKSIEEMKKIEALIKKGRQ